MHVLRVVTFLAASALALRSTPARADEAPPLPTTTEHADPPAETIVTGAKPTDKVTIHETRRGRIVVVIVRDESSCAAPTAATSAVSATEPRRSTVPWILVSVGAAFVTASLVYELVAINERATVTEYQLHLGRTDLARAELDSLETARKSHEDAAKRDDILAVTTGALGIASVAVGITWLALSQKRPSTTALAPAMGPRSAGLVLSF